MKKIIVALSILFLPFPSHAQIELNTSRSMSQECKVIRVVDGDTIEVPLSCLPKDMKLFVRVNGVDTPEKAGRAKCPAEAALAKKASELTNNLVSNSNSIVILTNPSWDKFGGRMLADVTIQGTSLTQSLITAKVAREYHGELKKSWCK